MEVGRKGGLTRPPARMQSWKGNGEKDHRCHHGPDSDLQVWQARRRRLPGPREANAAPQWVLAESPEPRV